MTTEKMEKTDEQKTKKYDMFVNAYSGIGGDHDPLNRFSFSPDVALAQTELEDLFRHNWVSRRIVESYAQNSVRQGIDLKIKDDKDGKIKTSIKGIFDELKIIDKVEELITLGRLYGGAVLIIGGLDGKNPSLPLQENAIDKISFFNVLDRWQLRIEKTYEDPLSNNYGTPEIYTLQPSLSGSSTENHGLKIHESRIIRFDGAFLPPNSLLLNEGWHDSELQNPYQSAKQFGISMQSGAVLLVDFITKVLKIPSLDELLGTPEGLSALQTRINYAMANMSTIGITLLGENEEFSKIQTPITGLVEMVKLFMNQVSSAAKIPEPVLFGQALGVLAGATESTRTWYDMVKGYQEKKVRPVLERIIKLLFLAKNSPTKGMEPDEWSFSFNPLWQEDESTVVTKRKTQAEADAIYLDRGVVLPEEITASRFGVGGYSIETTVDNTLREEAKAQEGEDETKELELLRAKEESLKNQQTQTTQNTGNENTP